MTMKNCYSNIFPAINSVQSISVAGIYPFSRNKFTDDDFECSEVTNRPVPAQQAPLIVASENVAIDQTDEMIFQVSATVTHSDINDAPNAADLDVDQPVITVTQAIEVPQIVFPAPSAIDSDATDAEDIEVDQPIITPTKAIDTGPVVANFVNMSPPHELDHEVDELATTTEGTNKAPLGLITPKAIRPYPKAAPRTGRKGRKKGSSRILTDTPEKHAMEAANLDRIKRKPAIVPLSKRGNSTANTSTKTKKKKTSRGDQSNLKSDGKISLHDDSDMDASDSLNSFAFDAQVANEESIQYLRNEDLNENDYVLVKCHSTKNDAQMYFVAIIKRKDESMFLVSFMKKKFGYKFLFPDKEDRSFIPIMTLVNLS